MIGWNFPSNNNGQKTALNDAGIEIFRGEPIASLAREVIQNSIDAHQSGDTPVEVHFTLDEISSSDFPGQKNLLKALSSSKDFWKILASQEFFDIALGALNSDKLSVLKISDFNTSGLTGADREENSNWEILIKSTGASDKPAGAGGSFGIGKNAPFACTPLRTIFYSTLDIDGLQAFQGVSKLVTHKNDKGETTQGTGFYGLQEKNAPILDTDLIPEMFKRTRTGTDLFIFGFSADSDWEKKIIQSVLESFFIAIHQEKLKVVVGSTLITKANLGELITKYFEDKNSNCPVFYEAYASGEAVFKENNSFESLGRIELHVLRGSNFPKRVALFRKTGMLIFERGHFQTPMKFAGVLQATGDEINSLLRSLEPPAHDKWEASRHPDPEYAARILKALYKWIRDCISEISHDAIQEEYDFEGMQQYLPDDSDEEPRQSDADAEDQTLPAEVDLVIRQTKKQNQAGDHSPSEDAGTDGDSGTTPDGSEGDNDSTGGAPDADTGGGGEGGGSAEPGDGKPAGGRTPIKLKKVRAFCSNPAIGSYKVIFEPQKAGNGMLELTIVGEVEQQPAPVLTAQMNGNVVEVDSKGLIGPISFIPGACAEITVVLDNPLRCALGVAAYENQ